MTTYYFSCLEEQMHPHEEEFALAVETALNQEIKTVVFTYANFGFITHS